MLFHGKCFAQVGVHPRDHERNVIGRPIQGPALLQIWAVPTLPQHSSSRSTAAAAAAGAASAAQPSSTAADHSLSITAAQDTAWTGRENLQEASAQPPGQPADSEEGAGCRTLEHRSSSAIVARSGLLEGKEGLPRMVVGICSEGGLVWDCKWRPNPAEQGSERHAPHSKTT